MLLDWYYRTLIANELNSTRGELRLRSAFFPRLKAIYIPVPKAAGSTIMETLIAADGSPHLAAITDHNATDARHRMSALYDPKGFWKALHDRAYFRFAFVRNPYTRVLSAYLEKGRIGKLNKWLGLPLDATLHTFLQRVLEQNIGEMNRHWRPQSALLSPKLKLDFLGRFERFGIDFNAILELVGVPASRIRERRWHQTSAESNFSFIGIEEKALIDRIYREDFERFGYSARSVPDSY